MKRSDLFDAIQYLAAAAALVFLVYCLKSEGCDSRPAAEPWLLRGCALHLSTCRRCIDAGLTPEQMAVLPTPTPCVASDAVDDERCPETREGGDW